MAQEAHQASTEFRRLAIALGIIAVILGAFILYLSWPLLTGTEITLATAPIDPFDPIRGQYMAIRYEISTLNATGFTQGETVYVALAPDAQGIWREQSVSHSMPRSSGGPAPVFIRGAIAWSSSERIGVKYGVEQFFFERDAYVPTRNVTVRLKVDSSGQARIVELLQNNKSVNVTYKPVTLRS